MIQFLNTFRISHHAHGTCVAVVVVGVLCSFALAMEDNTSRLLYIPKSEFIQVIRGILFPDNEEAEVVGEDGENIVSSSKIRNKNVINTPRSEAIRKAVRASSNAASHGLSDVSGGGKTAASSSSALRQRGGKSSGLQQPQVNHDSFYFLQRTLEKRQRQISIYQEQLNSHRSRYSPRDGMSSDNEYLVGSHAT